MVHNLPIDQGWGHDFRMIQVRYIYCVLYVYYYYISSTSDHQVLDPGGWGPLSQLSLQGMAIRSLRHFLCLPVIT